MIYQEERPYVFDAMLGQQYVVENIRNQSVADQWFSVYIFEGQFGSGKTSMARIVALAANCTNKDERGNPCLQCENCRQILTGGLDFKEIDGANNSSVENIRNLKEYIDFLPTKLKYKVIIIDEVHMLSKAGFNSMLKMLEEPPEYAIFILCTTELQAIPMTIRSRAGEYSFNRLLEGDVVKGLLRAAPKYGIELEPVAATLLANYSDGSMRNAYVLLEQVSIARTKVDEAVCMEVLGIVNEDTLYHLVQTILDHDLQKFIGHLDEMEQSGKSFSLVAADLLQACADLVMAKCGAGSRIGGTSYYRASIEKLSESYSLEDLCMLASSLKDIRLRTQHGSKYEFIVYMITVFNNTNQNEWKERVQNIEARLETLEKGIPMNAAVQENTERKPDYQDTEMEIDQLYPVPSTDQESAWETAGPSGYETPFTSNQEEEEDFDFDSVIRDMNSQMIQQYTGAAAYQPAKAYEEEPKQTTAAPERDEESADSSEGDNTTAKLPDNQEREDLEVGQPVTDAAAGAVSGNQEGSCVQPEGSALKQLEDCISQEPILASRYHVFCRAEEQESGEVRLFVSDQALYAQMLMFVAQNSLKNVCVELEQL